MNKILIVEDDHNLGLMIKDILGFEGYDVMLLKKPDQTIENITNNEFNLVIIDKLMSGIDGTQVCAKIRNTSGMSTMPVLMMSALPDVKDICIAAGANDFIYKPFEIKLLYNKVKTLIDDNSNI